MQRVNNFYGKLIMFLYKTDNDVPLGKFCEKSFTLGHNHLLPHPSHFIIWESISYLQNQFPCGQF
jgi:hypothetical protein